MRGFARGLSAAIVQGLVSASVTVTAVACGGSSTGEAVPVDGSRMEEDAGGGPSDDGSSTGNADSRAPSDGSSTGSADGGGSRDVFAGIPIDDLPELYVDAYCTVLESCFGTILAIYLPGESCDTLARAIIEDELPRLKMAIDAGRINYDGTLIQTCFDEMKAGGCDTTMRSEEACQAALDGTIPTGGACTMDAECSGLSYCQFSATMCPGVCAAAGSAGAPCERDDQCASGLVCGDTALCVMPAGAGDPCEGGVEPPCQSGFICLGQDEQIGQPGSCGTASEIFIARSGEPCSPSTGPLCAPGLSCVIESVTPSIAFTCVTLVASGGSCRPGLPDSCPPDEFCSVPSMMIDGTCTPKPVAGEPCARGPFTSPVEPPDICAPNTRCDGGTCRERQRLGGTCAEDRVCFTETCVMGNCASTGACD